MSRAICKTCLVTGYALWGWAIGVFVTLGTHP